VNNPETVSERLVRLRKEKGLAQKELAARSGLSPRMIAYYENEVSHPSLDKIEKIATALGVSTNELLGTSDSKAPSEQSEFISSVNTKTLKQFKKILQLSPQDRSTIYRMVDGLLQKQQEKRDLPGFSKQ
jgi:transcriptional regulator with XRE-family HTH domain